VNRIGYASAVSWGENGVWVEVSAHTPIGRIIEIQARGGRQFPPSIKAFYHRIQKS
jgi:hypothetical protein